MSVLANSSVISSGGVVANDISHSLRCRSAASVYASRTFVTPTSNTSWCYSEFVKRGALGALMSLLSAGDSEVRFNADNTLSFYKDGAVVATTSAYFRDPTSHEHLFIRSNGTYVKAFWNTVEVLSYTGTIPDLNSVVLHTLGKYAASATEYFDGYRSRICFVDGGGSLAPTDFVRFNSTTNEWVSKTQSEVKALVDAGGNNSTMLDFDDATSLTTLGYDKSTHGNHWTLNNFSLTPGVTYDLSLWGSYATLNPLNLHLNATVSPRNANITLGYAGAGWFTNKCTMPMSTGKWYAENVWETVGAANYSGLGVILPATPINGQTYPGLIATSWGLVIASNVVYAYNAGAATHTQAGTYNTSSTGKLAVDFDSGKGWLGINDLWLGGGDPAAGTTPTFTFTPNTEYVFAIAENAQANNHFVSGAIPLQAASTYQSAAGGYFTRTVPAGFKALCQANLPTTETIITSGTFTGNANADGYFYNLNGVPLSMTINGNAVTWGTHADKLSTGFKIRTALTSYNATGSNTFVITSTGSKRKYALAQSNP